MIWTRRAPGRLVRACLAAAVAALALTCARMAAAATINAQGSSEQVYVTGLSAGERMSLVNGAGRVVATQAADSLGGLLFRSVTPGSGYRVRVYPDGAESAAITVHSDAAAPWDPSIYSQTIKDNGYGVPDNS